MPTLHWIGKEKVVNHHREVPFRVLKHVYGFSAERGKISEPTQSGNKIIHGDNLEALKSLLPEYEGKIKCIYIDPPYNTGNENWVYNDNVNDPRIKKWLNEVVGKDGDDLSRHDKWLCMMYPRLKLLYRLLKEQGVIFVSLDENEVYNLRHLMNEIFGESNFIAQITLLCNPKGRSQDKHFSTNHEYLVVFSKGPMIKDSFSIEKDDSLILKEYKKKDWLGNYRLLELRNTHREFNRSNRPNLFYPFFVNATTGNVSLSKTGNYSIEVLPIWPDGLEGCWTWGKELAQKDHHLLQAQKKAGSWKIYRKSYSNSGDGSNVKKKLFTIWNDPKFFTEKGQATFGEIFPGLSKNDFPQPKSVDLILEILRTCTKKNDIILDSFSGSGTTGHAVLNLNKIDGGIRNFILIEMNDYAETITSERLKRVISGYKADQPTGTGGSFDFYELGPALFSGEQNEILNEQITLDDLRKYIWFSETRKSFQPSDSLNGGKYYLGSVEGTAYYLVHEKGQLNTVDHNLLSSIKVKAEQYVFYADNCLLSDEFMTKNKIIFKKIPREVSRF